MPKLTDYLRRYIERELINNYKEPREAAFANRDDALAREALADYLVHSYVDVTVPFDRLPKEWFCVDDDVRWVLPSGGPMRSAKFKEPRALPDAVRHGHAKIADARINRDYRELRDDRRAFEKEVEALRNRISALLHSCSTHKQLLDAWPEVAQYLPREITVKNLPVPSVLSLNKQLGLGAQEVKTG